MGTRKIEGTSRRDMFAMDSHDLVIVGLDTEADISDPLYDPVRVKNLHDPEMVASIRAHGVLVPVSAELRAFDKFAVVLGKRRTFNCRIASEESIKAGGEPILINVVRRTRNDLESILVTAAENAIRVGDPLIEKARKAARMVDQHGASHEQIAVAYGVTANAVRGWLKLTQAVSPVLKAVAGGELSESAAIQLAGLHRDEQMLALEKLRADSAEGIKPTKTAAKQAARDVVAAKSGGETEQTMPGVREMKRWIERAGTHQSPLTTSQLELVEHLCGLRKIPGMAAFRRAAMAKPAKAKK